jgi:hypothetical protein
MLIIGDRHLRSILLSTRPTTTEGTPVATANSGRRSPTTHRRPFPGEPLRRRPVFVGLINEYERAR